MNVNKKLLLASVILTGSVTAYAGEVTTTEEVVVAPAPTAYPYVGPNYSGYYNYTPTSAYPYVGPNYSGYYNYPFPQRVNLVRVQEEVDLVIIEPQVIELLDVGCCWYY